MAKRITDIPGASAVFLGGVVTAAGGQRGGAQRCEEEIGDSFHLVYKNNVFKRVHRNEQRGSLQPMEASPPIVVIFDYQDSEASN